MKRILKHMFQRAGWELHRVNHHARQPTMHAALQWLATQRIRCATILDVGASNGCWSAACMQYFPAASYMLFEPQPVHSAALDQFAQKHAPQVQIVKQAVGASVGSTFFDCSDPFGGALASENSTHPLEVPLTSLDVSLAAHRAAPPYLLKLDTHGFERAILQGAAQTLAHCNALIIEAYNYHITNEAFLFWELCAFLAERNFRVIDLVDVIHRSYDQSLWQMDLVFVKQDWPGFNYTTYE
jgi:FkbM family methyltransferase